MVRLCRVRDPRQIVRTSYGGGEHGYTDYQFAEPAETYGMAHDAKPGGCFMTEEEVPEFTATFSIDSLASRFGGSRLTVRRSVHAHPPRRAMLSKAEVLSDLRGGGLTFHAIGLAHERVRLSRTTALLTGESRTTAERNGSCTESRVQLLAVYVSDGQAIRLLHFQSTPLGSTT